MLPSTMLTSNQKQQMTHTNGPFTTNTEAYLANKKGKPKNSFCFVIHVSNLKPLLCSF